MQTGRLGAMLKIVPVAPFAIFLSAWTQRVALPLGRKDDPSFDMDVFRSAVTAIMDGTAFAPALIPPVEPPARSGASTGRPTLRRPTTGEQVKQVQAKLKVPIDGNFGPKTEAAVRAFQRDHGLVPDGIVGPKTWATLDSLADPSG